MMSESLTPQQQELLAGYVLGDLDSEELAQFQSLMQQNPGLEAEVLGLQEVLGSIPLGLDLEEPPLDLRSRLLTSASPLSAPRPSTTKPPTTKPSTTKPSTTKPSTDIRQGKPHRIPWGRILGGVAIGGAIALGINNLQLRQQVATLQSDPTEISAQEYYPRDTWQTFEDLLVDHQKSLTRGQGPVDFATQNVAEIQLEFSDRTDPPIQILQLKKAQLLGGSFCELSQTKGIRLSYTVQVDHPANAAPQAQTRETLSFYQLMGSEGFPPMIHDQNGIPIHVFKGPNAFVWGDQESVYVLMGDVPLPEMRQLMKTIKAI